MLLGGMVPRVLDKVFLGVEMRNLPLSVLVWLSVFCLYAQSVLISVDSRGHDLTSEEKTAVCGAIEVVKPGKVTFVVYC